MRDIITCGLGVADEESTIRPPGAERHNHLSETGERSMHSQTNFAACVLKLEVEQGTKGDLEGQVERYAALLIDFRGAEYLPEDVPTVDELLREQHAVREQIEPCVFEFPIIIKRGSDYAVQQEPDWGSDTPTRAGGLLQRHVRELLAKALRAESELADLRVHAQRQELEDWLSDREDEPRWSMDSMVRRWRPYERECRGGRNHVSGTNREDGVVYDVRPVLEYASGH